METVSQALRTRPTRLSWAPIFCAVLLLAPSSPAAVNSWIKPTSGAWEEQASWSLGVLPDQTQSIELTNAGWKAVAIGANTAQSFPGSMQMQSLRLASPPDSYNVLLMNFSGFERPLQTGSLVVETNSTVVVQSSALQVVSSTNGPGNLSLAASFYQGDYALVTVAGTLDIGSLGPGSYFLTNGALTVLTRESLGGAGPGNFVQYGGSNNVVELDISDNGEYDLYDGQATGTSFNIGFAGYSGSFFQYGGNINADLVVGSTGYGTYVLQGGSVSGRMSVPLTDRGFGAVQQSGGTNFAVSLDVGKGNTTGGQGGYALSNGVAMVNSSTTLGAFGSFYQSGGWHMIASNLVLQGRDLFMHGVAQAQYQLIAGTLSARSLTINIAGFDQEGGSDVIAGDVFIGPATQQSLYSLNGGFLSDSNVLLSPSPDGGFEQTNGSHQVANQLTIQGTAANFRGYTLDGGGLTVRDISISKGAAFYHRGGSVIQSGTLLLDQGDWQAAPGDQALGPLRLGASLSAASTIDFPNAPSILRLANSRGQPWASNAILYINNWRGSTNGPTHLYFGSDSSGCTAQQLAQVQFQLPGGPYPARILSSGEVVPHIAAVLSFAWSGHALMMSWGAGWTLQSSTNVAGPYTDVPSATSPYTVSPGKPREFFRLRQ
jgi:hypothetical protein